MRLGGVTGHPLVYSKVSHVGGNTKARVPAEKPAQTSVNTSQPRTWKPAFKPFLTSKLHFGAQSLSLFPPFPDAEGLSQRIRTWLFEEFVPKFAPLGHQQDFPRAAYQQMAAKGIIGAGISKEDKGQGLDAVMMKNFMQSLFRYYPHSVSSAAINTAVATLPIALAGSPLQREKLLPRLLSGKSLASIAVEDAFPSKLSDIDTTATYDADAEEWIISGKNLMVPHGDNADVVVLLAKTQPEGKALTFVLDQIQGKPGVFISEIQGRHGMNSAPLAKISLKEVRVPKTAIIGESQQVREGLSMFTDVLTMARIAETTRSTGALEALLDTVFFNAAARVDLANPNLNDAEVYHQLADMAKDVYTLQGLTDEVAADLEAYLKQEKPQKELASPQEIQLKTAKMGLITKEIEDMREAQTAQLLKDLELPTPHEAGEKLILPSALGEAESYRHVVLEDLKAQAKKEGKIEQEKSFKFLRWFVPKNSSMAAMKLYISYPKTPQDVAHQTLVIAEHLMQEALAFAGSQSYEVPPPLLRLKNTPENNDEWTATRLVIENPQAQQHLLRMSLELEKIRAGITRSEVEDNNPVSPIKLKGAVLDAMGRFVNAAEKFYTLSATPSQMDWVRYRLAEFAGVGGSRESNIRTVVTHTMKQAQELFRTPSGQAWILRSLKGHSEHANRLALLESGFRSMFTRKEKMFLPNHNDGIIWASHFLNKVALPQVFNIRSLVFSKADEDKLRDLAMKNQVFLAPNHPSGMPEVFVEWELLRRAAPPDQSSIKAVFMAAKEMFDLLGGQLQSVLPRLGAFSVNRGADASEPMAVMLHEAKKGEHLVVIHPRGEAEWMNHYVTPFKYGMANAAVEAALSRESKKPIVIAPLAMVFSYVRSIQNTIEERIVAIERRIGLPQPAKKEPQTRETLAQRLKLSFDVVLKELIGDLKRLTPEQGPIEVPSGDTVLSRINWLQKTIQERFELKYYGKIDSGNLVSRMRKLRGELYQKSEMALSKSKKAMFMQDIQLLKAVRDFVAYVPEAYKHLNTLTQDQVAETIIRLEEALQRPGVKNLHTYGVEYFGPRKVTAALTTPIHVNRWLEDAQDHYSSPKEAAAMITRQAEQEMQQKLNQLYTEIPTVPETDYPNFLLWPAGN